MPPHLQKIEDAKGKSTVSSSNPINKAVTIKAARTVGGMLFGHELLLTALPFLKRFVKANVNILISGATHAGKTTVLNSLLGSIPTGSRLITLEEVFELAPRVADHVALQIRQKNLEGTGEVSLRTLVRESLRMRPNYLVIGEVRGAEALDLLLALNSGIPGMASIHANSAHDALRKIATLPLLAGPNIVREFVVEAVQENIDVIIHCRQDGDGVRRIVDVALVNKKSFISHLSSESLLSWNGSQYIFGKIDCDMFTKFANLREILKRNREDLHELKGRIQQPKL